MNSIKLVFFLLVVFNLSSNCYAGNDFPPGDYRIELATGGRPSSPYPQLENYNRALTEQGTGSQFTVPVTRHHIIPFQLLRSFYNMVTTNGDLLRFRSFFFAMSQRMPFYASSNSIDCSGGGIISDLSGAATLAYAIASAYVFSGGQTPPPGLDTFQQFYTWLPGNLFIGPANRSDDPHDGMAFEVNAATVVGQERFRVLQRAYNNMLAYVQNGDRQHLGAIADDLSRIANVRSIYQLNADDWEFVSGQYKLTNNAAPMGRAATSNKDIKKTKDAIESSAMCEAGSSEFYKMRARYYNTIFLVYPF
ncbi:hypothetical protein [Aeromonas jandaei]|uniref:hypothetical protein n=1 Tax=Aeromonas jandaei TaxID=650 RepID=UPI003EC51359